MLTTQNHLACQPLPTIEYVINYQKDQLPDIFLASGTYDSGFKRRFLTVDVNSYTSLKELSKKINNQTKIYFRRVPVYGRVFLGTIIKVGRQEVSILPLFLSTFIEVKLQISLQ